MGKKYIIEFEDKPFFKNGDFLYRVKGFNSLVFDMTGIGMLTPYTEPDLEQVRMEAYEQGRKDVETQFCSYDACKNRQEEYQRGLADAWEAARKIGSNSMCSLKEMGFDFSRCAVADYNPSWFVVKNYSASECIEKIRQYEQTQKEEEKSIGAEDVMRQYLDTFCKRNFCTKCLLHTPDFTCGRGYHFLTNNPVSDEEVRRAYAKVVKE